MLRLSTTPASIDPLHPIHSSLARGSSSLHFTPLHFTSHPQHLVLTHTSTSQGFFCLSYTTPPIRKSEQVDQALPVSVSVSSLRIRICHSAPLIPLLHCRFPFRHRHKHPPPPTSTSKPFPSLLDHKSLCASTQSLVYPIATRVAR